MNQSLHWCITAYADAANLNSIVVYIISGLSILTLFLNFIGNSSIIYSLLLTEQLNNPSMRLIFYLSCSDLCMALLGQTTFVATTILDPKATCDLIILSEFFLQFFGHTSAYIIGLIGYDRYFRMKYLNRYSEFVSTCKLNIGLVGGIFIALIQCLMLTVGTLYKIYTLMTTLYQAIDVIMLIVILMPYILAVIVVKKHRKQAQNKELLKQVDKIITSTATRIMIAIAILYAPYILFTFPRSFLANESPIRDELWFKTCLIVGYVFAHSNSFVNACIFLSYNAQCREKVLSMIEQVFPCCCTIKEAGNERQITSTDTELCLQSRT